MYIRQIKFENDNQDTDSDEEGIDHSQQQNGNSLNMSEEIKYILIMFEEILNTGGSFLKTILQSTHYQEKFYSKITKYKFNPQVSEYKNEELKV
mmetsp:Transcript_30695/g.27888  ORF Transcript_30695/g.27888 Transcript_30695/m.27888 type:complete len:94 (+) Transcript_30695:512-793(+)